MNIFELHKLRIEKIHIASVRTYDFFVSLKTRFAVINWSFQNLNSMTGEELQRWKNNNAMGLVIKDSPKLERLLDRAIDAKKDSLSQ